MRKILIGLISLGGVLAAYLLYTGLSDSPGILDDPGAELVGTFADSNVGEFDPNVGKIGDIGIGRTELAQFVTRNEKTRAVEQISGFKTLLSKERGLWEVEEPYIIVFEREFTCYITADHGLVQMESAADRMTPKDATFTGKVVIHVVPKENGEWKESIVYLDDIVILSERSQISTDGPVKYVSDDVRMLGRGLQLIYNDRDDRIEFFRIFHLETLLLKNYVAGMFSTDEPEAVESSRTLTRTESPQDGNAVVEGGPEATREPTGEEIASTEPNDGVYYQCILSRNVLIDTPDELIFADQMIRITDIFWSGETIASEPNDANDAEAVATTGQAPLPAEAVAVAGQAAPPTEPNGVSTDYTIDANIPVVAAVDPNTFSAEPGDAVIRCDNGIVLVPMDTRRPLAEFLLASAGSSVEPPAEFESDTERTKFLGRRIDYNKVTGDVTADGPSNLELYTRDRSAADANEPSGPLNITAQDSVKFFGATNQLVFEGDCLGSMLQKGLTEPRDIEFESPKITVTIPEDRTGRPEVFASGPAKATFYIQDVNAADTVVDANAAAPPEPPVPVTVTAQKHVRFSTVTVFQEADDPNGVSKHVLEFEGACRCETTREDPNGVTEYMLLSELMTAVLPEDANASSSGLTDGIEKFTATGGVVRLVTTTTAKGDPSFGERPGDVNEPEILGGVEIKCSLVEYDPNRGLFEASGAPGEIQIDNSNAVASDRDPNGFSLKDPCYAFLANFESLKYYINENRIVANAVPGGALWLHYVPVVNGVHDLDAIITASALHVQASLAKTPDGRTELSTLRATGGIDINDLSNGNHFIGSNLYYDHKTAIMRVIGDETRPCLCNGALVDEIEYNVNTGKLKSELVGPGPMQTNQ